MARMARAQADGYLSSGVSVAESACQSRRVERPTEGYGRARPTVAQEVQVLKICHGNSSRPRYRPVLGIRGSVCAICHAPDRHFSHDAVHADVRILFADAGDAASWWLGAPVRRIRMAAVGLGNPCGSIEHFGDAGALSLVRNRQAVDRCANFRVLSGAYDAAFRVDGRAAYAVAPVWPGADDCGCGCGGARRAGAKRCESH